MTALIRAGTAIATLMCVMSATALGQAFRVRDINPGAANGIGGPGQTVLVPLGDRVLFGANDGVSGIELWVSDGTETGTALVQDILSGPASSEPFYVRENPSWTWAIRDGAIVYFRPGIADNDFNGFADFGSGRLWRTDGTPAGTAQVSSAVTEPRQPLLLGGTLFFAGAAADFGTGSELWKSDGTEAGTALLKDIRLGSVGSDPTFLAALSGGIFLFGADDGALGRELWKSDGTDAGTMMVKDINAGAGGSLNPNVGQFVSLGGRVFFPATDGTTGIELWVSDGTALGTTLVKDIYPGPWDSGPSALFAYHGEIFFSATDGVSGRELWRSDGTETGTTLVKDICVGNCDALATAAFPTVLPFFAISNDLLFFAANDGVHGREPWKTDGTGTGTLMVADINAGASSFPTRWTDAGGRLYFVAVDAHGLEVWRSDGTALGTVRLTDVNPTGHGIPSAGYNLAVADTMLFFVGDDGVSGYELWALPLSSPPVDVDPHHSVSILRLSLERNPAVGAARIRFDLPQDATLSLEVFDTRGSRIATLAKGAWSAGPHTISWDAPAGRSQSPRPGIYFVRLSTGGEMKTVRLVMLR